MTQAVSTALRAVLADVDSAVTFGIGEAVEAVEKYRRRKIVISPVDIPSDGPCGLLVSTTAADHIYYATTSSPFHRDHTILHELGHLLLDHADHDEQSMSDQTIAALQSLMPNLSEDALRRALGRSAYSRQEEFDAELFATLVGAHLATPRQSRRRSGVSAGTAVGRLHAAFGLTPDSDG